MGFPAPFSDFITPWKIILAGGNWEWEEMALTCSRWDSGWIFLIFLHEKALEQGSGGNSQKPLGVALQVLALWVMGWYCHLMVLSDNDLKLNDLFLKIPSLQVHSLLEPPCTFLHIPNQKSTSLHSESWIFNFFPLFSQQLGVYSCKSSSWAFLAEQNPPKYPSLFLSCSNVFVSRCLQLIQRGASPLINILTFLLIFTQCCWINSVEWSSRVNLHFSQLSGALAIIHIIQSYCYAGILMSPSPFLLSLQNSIQSLSWCWNNFSALN